MGAGYLKDRTARFSDYRRRVSSGIARNRPRRGLHRRQQADGPSRHAGGLVC